MANGLMKKLKIRGLQNRFYYRARANWYSSFFVSWFTFSYFIDIIDLLEVILVSDIQVSKLQQCLLLLVLSPRLVVAKLSYALTSFFSRQMGIVQKINYYEYSHNSKYFNYSYNSNNLKHSQQFD
jgi:hypothetical protein